MSTSSEQPRRELAEQFARLGRTFIDREMPILTANGIGMWEYAILTVLRRTSAPTQVELARLTGRDKTRLIGNLDTLEASELIARQPDQADRRATRVEITDGGRVVVDRCRKAIRQMEDSAMADLSSAEREVFLRVLARLATDS